MRDRGEASFPARSFLRGSRMKEELWSVSMLEEKSASQREEFLEGRGWSLVPSSSKGDRYWTHEGKLMREEDACSWQIEELKRREVSRRLGAPEKLLGSKREHIGGRRRGEPVGIPVYKVRR